LAMSIFLITLWPLKVAPTGFQNETCLELPHNFDKKGCKA
jgi:hypothetical protein